MTDIQLSLEDLGAALRCGDLRLKVNREVEEVLTKEDIDFAMLILSVFGSNKVNHELTTDTIKYLKSRPEAVDRVRVWVATIFGSTTT